ncbi:hypothetical protein IJT93_04980, partial [bacterium]|nr:hypothetical protein [bacterium]
NVFVQSSRNLNSFRSQAETTVIEKLPMLEGENRQEEIEKTAKMLFIKEKLKNMQLGEPLDHIKF